MIAMAEPGAKKIDAETAQIIEALEGRASFYDFIASLYYLPLSADQIENLAHTDFSPYKEINDNLSEGFEDIERALHRRNTGTRQELAVDFTSAFAGTASWKGKYAVPYESVFTSDEGLLFQDAYHEVCQLYRENHVHREEGYDFPDDHLSFMCEFLALLSKRAIDALEAEDREGALEQMVLSRDFLQSHILSWFDAFSTRALLLLKTRFYKGVLKISKGFFLYDAQSLDELVEELSK